MAEAASRIRDLLASIEKMKAEFDPERSRAAHDGGAGAVIWTTRIVEELARATLELAESVEGPQGEEAR